jgi:hypothetical protein
LFVVAALLALLAGLLAETQPARANTYIVTNTNNSGAGSLRQAITNANNNPGADTITFARVTDGTPIVLAGAAGEDDNVSGDLDILDGGNLTIQGNGAANTIIDGGGIDRVFHVCPSGGCANTVTFNSVTIRNGSVGGYGGGIYNRASTVTVDGSLVSANAATYGGGIYTRAKLTIQNGSTIGMAGAGNTATDHAGGIYNQAGTATVDGSTVSANSADLGGGILNQATLIVQNGSTIGGAGAGNTATADGGGILNYIGGTTTVDGSAVSANTATLLGGGIFNQATLNIENGSTIGEVGADNTAIAGGGIYNLAGITTLNGSAVSGNTATAGGGIYIEAGAMIMNGSTISANSADSGGGIYNQATPLNIQNGSTIGGAGAGNSATNYGGGIYNKAGTVTVDGNAESSERQHHRWHRRRQLSHYSRWRYLQRDRHHDGG